MKIGFSSGSALLSRIIKKLTRSKVSHSYIVFKVEEQELVVQANQHGVCCQHYEEFKKNSNIVTEYEIKMTKAQESVALRYALGELLKPYDVWGLIGFGWVLLNKMFGRKVKQPFTGRSAYLCSEFVVATLQAAGLDGVDSLDSDIASPEDVMMFLENHKKRKVV